MTEQQTSDNDNQLTLEHVEALCRAGEFEAAVAAGAALLAELQVSSDATHAALAKALRALAEAHQCAGNVKRATALAEQACALWNERAKLEDVEAAELGALLHMRAISALQQDELGDAMPLLEEAATHFESQQPACSGEFLAVLLTIAEVGQATGDAEAAANMYQRVLDEVTDIDPESPEHAQQLNAIHGKAFLGLGGAHARGGDPEQARESLTRSLEFFEASFEYGHPMMHDALSEVAAIYRHLGEPEAAQAIEDELARAAALLKDLGVSP